MVLNLLIKLLTKNDNKDIIDDFYSYHSSKYYKTKLSLLSAITKIIGKQRKSGNFSDSRKHKSKKLTTMKQRKLRAITFKKKLKKSNIANVIYNLYLKLF